MDCVTMKARAKINLALDVLGKREDGYHELRMIMQNVNLHDTVRVRKANKAGSLKLVSNLPWLPADGRNLAYRAAETLRERCGISGGIFIELVKRIPVSAGLAGGSSDCAATLAAIRRLFRLPLSDSELMEIGGGLGADVPYCLMCGSALAEGRGEILTRLAPMPRAWVLLAKPTQNVSTAEVFREYRPDSVKQRPDIDRMTAYIEAGDLRGICSGLCNVLENVTTAEHPIIGEIKNLMLNTGALAALMSGSGPSVFGIYESRGGAALAARELRRELPQVREVFVTDFYNVGVGVGAGEREND